MLLLSFSGNLVQLFNFYIFYILQTYRNCFKMMKTVKEKLRARLHNARSELKQV